MKRKEEDSARKARRLVTRIAITCAVIAAVMLLTCCGSAQSEKKEIEGIIGISVETEYDGQEHGIEVRNTVKGDEIYYARVKNGEWSKSEIKYKTPGEYTVYFRVERKGYKAYESEARIVILKQTLSGISAEDKECVYDGKEHGIEIRGTQATDEITYSVNGGEYSAKHGEIEVGEYIVCYRVEREYGEYAGESVLRILPRIQGRYINAEAGIITLTERSAIENGDEKELKYGIDGHGAIGGEAMSANGDILKYKGADYARMAETDRAYRINVNGISRYAVGGESLNIIVSYDDSCAIVTADGTELIRCNGMNYCETSEPTDYATLTTKIAVESTGELTETEIELSERAEQRDIDAVKRIAEYDGKAHGYEIVYDGEVLYKTADGEYTSEAPKFTEVGKYVTETVYKKTGYLPKVTQSELEIAPGIRGEYYTHDAVVVITETRAEMNGRIMRREYVSGRWELNGIAVEITETGIVYVGIEYKRRTDERLTVVMLNGKATVATERYRELQVEYDKRSGTVTVTSEGSKVLNESVQGETATVRVNGVEQIGITDDDTQTFILGTSELDLDLAVVVIDISID